MIHLGTEECLRSGYSIKSTLLPFKACVTRGLREKYETDKDVALNTGCNHITAFFYFQL